MKIVKHIFKKELREMLRDKRVRSSALFGPMFMSFLIMFMFGFLMDSVGKPQNQKIHVVRANGDNDLVRTLKQNKFNVQYVESKEEGERLIKDGKAALVLEFEDDWEGKLKRAEPAKVTAYLEKKNDRSSVALRYVKNPIETINKAVLEATLKKNDIDPKRAQPIQLEESEVKISEKSAGSMLIGFLPYIIVIWAFYGGISIATDLVAGEKEKGTLETLLISPAGRQQIALGKFWALAVVCLSSCISAVLGVFIAGRFPMAKAVFADGGVAIETFPIFLALLIPAVILFASILLAISTFAKNPREAQTHLNLAGFAVMTPAIFSQLLGFTDFATARWINFVPVLNTAASLRNVLLGKNDWIGFGITVGVSLLLALIAMTIAIKLFNREEVLKRV